MSGEEYDLHIAQLRTQPIHILYLKAVDDWVMDSDLTCDEVKEHLEYVKNETSARSVNVIMRDLSGFLENLIKAQSTVKRALLSLGDI